MRFALTGSKVPAGTPRCQAVESQELGSCARVGRSGDRESNLYEGAQRLFGQKYFLFIDGGLGWVVVGEVDSPPPSDQAASVVVQCSVVWRGTFHHIEPWRKANVGPASLPYQSMFGACLVYKSRTSNMYLTYDTVFGASRTMHGSVGSILES